ncbi:hypothetical protein D3C87_1708810 [compost metagenome]
MVASARRPPLDWQVLDALKYPVIVSLMPVRLGETNLKVLRPADKRKQKSDDHDKPGPYSHSAKYRETSGGDKHQHARPNGEMTLMSKVRIGIGSQ